MADKGKKILLRAIKFLLLALVLLIAIAGGTLFLMRDRNMATGLIRDLVLKTTRDSGLEAELGQVSGNPLKGYTFQDLMVRSEDIFQVDLETLVVEVSFRDIFRGRPLKRVYLKDGKIQIPDTKRLSELGNGKPRDQEEKKGLPHIPLEVENLVLEIMDKRAVIASSDILLSSTMADLSLSGSIQEISLSADLMLQMDGNKSQITHGELLFGEKGRIILSGDLSPGLTLQGEVKDLELEDLLEIIPGETPAGKGTLNLDMKGGGTLSEPEIKGILEMSQLALEGMNFQSLRADWGLRDKTFYIHPLVVDLLGSYVSMDLEAGMDRSLDIRMSGDDLDMSQLGDFLGKEMDSSGRVETLKGHFSGILPEISGDILARSGKLTIGGEEIRELEFRGSIDPEKISFSSSLRFLESMFQAKGTMGLTGKKELDMDVSFKEADLARMSKKSPLLASLDPKGKVTLLGKVGGDIADPFAKVSLSSPQLDLMGENFQDLQASLIYREKEIDIEKAGFSTLGGEVKASGKITNIGSDPSLDMDLSALGVDLSRSTGVILERFPSARGITDLDISITGDLANPVIDGSLQSRQLELDDLFSAEEVYGQIMYKNDGLHANLESPLAILRGLITQDLAMVLKWVPGELTIEKADLSLLGGNFNSSGKILMDKDLEMDLKGTFDELAIEKLPFKIPLDLSAQTYGAFSLKGPPTDPDYTFKIMTPAVEGGPFTIESIRLEGFGDLDRVILEEGSAFLGQGNLQVKGTIELPPGDLKADFSISGEKLDLKYLSPKTEKRQALLQGLMDLEGSLDITGSSDINMALDISSEEISLSGFTIKEISIPVRLSREKIEVPSWKASPYGGEMKGALTMSLPGQEWNTWLELASMDLAPAMDDLGTFPGSLSGKAFGSVKVRGRGSERFNLFGNGDLTVTEGQIKGLPAIKAAAATAGRDYLAYSKIRSNYLIDGFGLTLLAGTRIMAPSRDPIYKYLNIDGVIEYDGKIDLKGNSEVNLQAFNAFMGGLKIALQAALSPEALTQGLLGGLTGSLGKKDFKEVTFHISGTREKPEIQELKIEGGEEYLSDIINPEDFSEEKEDEQQFQIKLNIPVGPGGDSEQDTGEDLKEQLLKNIFKSIQGSD